MERCALSIASNDLYFPIFKKGLKSDPNNYPPVSLTLIIGKLLETLLRKEIQDHLVSNSLI